MMDVSVTAGEADGIKAALMRMGLAEPSQDIALTPLTGGVSSIIVRADVGGRSLCVKRALSKLKVARDWEAPVERSNAEAALSLTNKNRACVCLIMTASLCGVCMGM